jgi:hypothetical protein
MNLMKLVIKFTAPLLLMKSGSIKPAVNKVMKIGYVNAVEMRTEPGGSVWGGGD